MMYRRSNFGGKCGVQLTGCFSMRSKRYASKAA
ncbi:hypothetical protein JMJ77_0006298, partial [Colletotrichum scovillei]